MTEVAQESRPLKQAPQPFERRISSVRLAPRNQTAQNNLGLLEGLSGSWRGHGFNLIARPDKEGGGPLFLELNQTDETLKIDPIGSNIPNRGFAQLDIELFGLTYLQKISDSVTGGALHIEPGIWVTQPETTEPPVAPPPSGQIVARLATIPHGNAALIQGSAILIPELAGGTFDIPPVNTAPFPAGGSQPPPGTQGGFPAYNLADSSPAAVNFRTPFGNNPAVPLPTKINTISLQKIINDPTRLLQQAIKGQNIKSMVLIRISTADDSTVPDSGGGIENIPFLTTNADVATVDATFWLETIEEGGVELLQLQYVQTVMLNFPVLNGPEPQTLLSWPHVSVATLRKSFG